MSITRVEFRAAVRQRQRAGDVPEGVANALLARAEQHLQTLYLVQPLTEAVLEEASALLDRHALRAYDAMQVAGCLSLRSRIRERPFFVCADRQLLRAAQSEGLAVSDPAEQE